ncbi:protein tyrosine/serine phosphatase [Ochrobactrum daejeonense]|uniref:Protein tyrosine/serine phosphatase n=1 Tax=Brucella daejeonensis TaxID=659015 RepID=A0A7W9EL49_9HYPH|nr:tyrosine-protein phosphatase [Brucella daejeonensis]MBB5700321.1 protein tyrosine/serine phosphatase [Brucella daejeonensis]NKB78463.1 dual specificity protein phosphatase family protein [Brucella daejeonensis]
MTFFKRYTNWSISYVRLTGLGLVIGAGFMGGYLYTLQYKGNVHTVLDGQVYRSNQPDPARIANLQKLYGIRTIINLRGPEPGEKWYDEEIAAAETLGIRHADFEMSARRQLSPEEARQLIALMAKAEKPVLIHCKSGSDRTGLAAALYVAAIAKGSESKAERQMSIAYGHFGFPLSPTYAMERTFEAIEAELGYTGS